MTPPTKGRIVLYHHPQDQEDWPAVILQIRGEEGNDGRGEEVLLQVLRPRGNTWLWASEGTNDGQWSWPQRHKEE